MSDEKKAVCLKLENVSKVFAKVESDQVTHALQDVSVEMSGGEFVSLVGPSGCGKSTILRLVAGLITPTLGRVTVNGEEISGPSPSRGLVFQNPTLFPWLTAEKNISFSLDLRGDDKGKAEKVEHMLEITGLTQFRHDYPAQLSGGMAQRVTIALAACSRARLLIADEPTNGLDEAGRAQFFALLDSIFPDAAKLIITHDISVAARCDRVLVLCGGRMLETGVSSTVLSAPRHPYTKALLAAQVANGMQPSPILREGTSGCPFYTRCPETDAGCLNGAMSKHTDGKTEWWCCHA